MTDGPAPPRLPVRVLLVDDVPDLRFLYGLILRREAEGRYEVVGEAGDGREAIALAERLRPDLVLLDVSMPVMDGMDALPHILRASPGAKVVMLSGFSAERLGRSARERGAAHYLEKGVTPRDLVRELDRVMGLAPGAPRSAAPAAATTTTTATAAAPSAARATTAAGGAPPPATASASGEEDSKLERRIADLQQANRELEAFSFTVSHDLRAPLRGIGYLAQALEDDATELTPEHRDLVRKLRGESERMSRFVEDLLTLSRANRGECHLERVDLTRLARDVAARLRKDEPARDVDLRIEEGLAARGDPDLLAAVVENLLGNAWKFTRRAPRARIEVGLDRQRPEPAFFVRDNGAGFDPARAGQLFEPFRRLHATADYEGTGVGLASVKRIVQRHGGRVWAESEPGKGATFWFTLPE